MLSILLVLSILFELSKLLRPHLKSPVASVTDRFGRQGRFLLQGQMNHAALGRIQHAKRKWPPVLPHLVACKSCHRVKLGLTCLTKAVGIDDETMLTIKLATKRLKKHDLKSIEHLAILGKSKMSVPAAQVQKTAFVCPLGRDIEIEPHIATRSGQKVFRFFASFVHISKNYASTMYSIWLHFLRVLRHRAYDLRAGRRIPLVHTVDHHLLAKTDDVTKEPI